MPYLHNLCTDICKVKYINRLYRVISTIQSYGLWQPSSLEAYAFKLKFIMIR